MSETRIRRDRRARPDPELASAPVAAGSGPPPGAVEPAALPDLGTLVPNVPVELVFRYAGGSAIATARTFYPPSIHELIELDDPELPIYGTVVDVVHRAGELEIVLARHTSR